MKTDVLIVGAGVIGLSIAHELLCRGTRVTLVDPGEPGKEASWAAAGVLAPQGARPVNRDYLDLCLAGLDLYTDWSAALLGETGIDVEYRTEAGLQVAFDDAGIRRTRSAVPPPAGSRSPGRAAHRRGGPRARAHAVARYTVRPALRKDAPGGEPAAGPGPGRRRPGPWRGIPHRGPGCRPDRTEGPGGRRRRPRRTYRSGTRGGRGRRLVRPAEVDTGVAAAGPARTGPDGLHRRARRPAPGPR